MGRPLGWHRVQHIEIQFPILAVTFSVRKPERGFPGGAVNSYQIALKVDLNTVFINVFLKCRDISRHTEQNRSGTMKLNIELAKNSVSAPMVGRQIHRFLRRR